MPSNVAHQQPSFGQQNRFMTENSQPAQQNNAGFNPNTASFGGFGSSASGGFKSFSNVSSNATNIFPGSNQQKS
jgi:hypothetical protein